MFGVIVNAVAVIVGTLGGLLIKSGLSDRFKVTVSHAVGMVSVFIGLSGAIGKMLDPLAHPLLFVISLVVGGLLGEWADIEGKLNAMGKFMERRIGADGFAKGFVSASLLFCVGSMSVIGALESGISGDHKTLLAKSVMDGVTSVVLASSYGIGVLFSAGTILVYEGAIALAAGALQSFLTEDMIREMSIVGGILIFAIGLDLLNIKRIKVGNFLPALFVPVVYYFITALFTVAM